MDGKDKWKSTRETDKKKALAVVEGHRAATLGALNTEELFQMLLVRIDALPIDERDDRRLDYGQQLIRMQAKRLTFSEAWERWGTAPARQGTNKIARFVEHVQVTPAHLCHVIVARDPNLSAVGTPFCFQQRSLFPDPQDEAAFRLYIGRFNNLLPVTQPQQLLEQFFWLHPCRLPSRLWAFSSIPLKVAMNQIIEV